jgi:S-adenosylmethionine synthetase
MANKNYLFTSESVSEGHPDKLADQVSDAILDAHLEQDKNSRVACETLLAKNLIVIAGEITSNAKIDFEGISKDLIKNIGYKDVQSGFDAENCKVVKSISLQEQEIANGVNRADNEIGAGDQGMMFGYATNETEELMPLPIILAHKILQYLAGVRHSRVVDWLRPDAKSQITVSYKDGKPKDIESVVLSTQHSEEIELSELKEFIIEEIIKNVISKNNLPLPKRYLINPAGKFTHGGPLTDTGLTGRKIIVDTYGGSCPHGGGAFSGKDPTKVDRSGAYMARYIAKNIVASNIADKCTVQISYAIGEKEPISLMLDFHGTGKVRENEVVKAIPKIFDLSPKGIIKTLDLLRGIYLKTASYGHFGRELPEFLWEKKDKADELMNLFIN